MIFNKVVYVAAPKVQLAAPSNLIATPGTGKISLTWTDPEDIVRTGKTVATWAKTRIVRKEGAPPNDHNDGVIVLESAEKNQYQSTPYDDSTVQVGTVYHYGAFSYSEEGVWSEGAFANATPKAGTPLGSLAEGTLIKILENGAPVEFYVAKQNYEEGLNGAGRVLCVRKDIHSKVVWNSSGVIVYAGSTIDTWQNRTYKSTLSGAVQSLIGTTSFYSSVSGNSEVAPLERAVFSLAEKELYNSGSSIVEGSLLPIANTLKFANYNGSPANWYTRTPYPPYEVTEMHTDGKGWSHSPLQASGVRPCFTLPTTALVDQDLNLIEEVSA